MSPLPNVVNVEGKLADSNAVHPENAPYPIVLTPSGTVIDVSAMFFEKAFTPILLRVVPKVTVLKVSQL